MDDAIESVLTQLAAVRRFRDIFTASRLQTSRPPRQRPRSSYTMYPPCRIAIPQWQFPEHDDGNHLSSLLLSPTPSCPQLQPPLHTHTTFTSQSPSPSSFLPPEHLEINSSTTTTSQQHQLVPPLHTHTNFTSQSPDMAEGFEISIERQRLTMAEENRIREIRMREDFEDRFRQQRELSEDRERKVRLEHDEEVRHLISDLQKKLDAKGESSPPPASVGTQWEDLQRQWHHDRSVSPLPGRSLHAQPTAKMIEYETGTNGESLEDICNRFRTDEERVRVMNPHLAKIGSCQALGPLTIVFVPVEDHL